MKSTVNKTYLKTFSFWWLVLVCFIALFASLLSNHKPLHVAYVDENKNTTHYTIDATNYRNEYLNNSNSYKRIFFAPIPYSAGETDVDNLGLKSPFEINYYTGKNDKEIELPLRFHHFLGTDQRGCDVLAGIINGTRYSLSIALFGMMIATLIALLTGILSGYFAEKGFALKRMHFVFLVVGTFVGWFYGFYMFRFVIQDSLSYSLLDFIKTFLLCVVIFGTIIYTFNYVGKISAKKIASKNISLPLDAAITRITETFTAIPSFILLVSIVAFAKPSVTTTVFIFGITAWTDLSRMVRLQVMKVKASSFVEAAIASGLNNRQIIFRHILPNIFPVIVPVVLYGIAMIILAESGLSFLGLGVESGTVTWGNLLAQGKENTGAWWLIVFPGTFIFLTVNSLYQLGKKIPKNNTG